MAQPFKTKYSKGNKGVLLKPIWILCNARSGSSILCEYLNNLDIFPILEHEEIEKRNSHLLKTKGAFNEFIRLYNSFEDLIAAPPMYLKCLDKQYKELTKDYLNYDSSFVKQIWPDIKFIKLKRNNLLEQAISLYCAKLTNKWHVYTNEELNEYYKTPIEYDLSLARECMQEIKDYDNWNWFVKEDYLEITYENLITHPEDVIQSILSFCNIKISKDTISKAIKITHDKKRIYKMTRPENLTRLFKSLDIKL